MAVNDAWKSEVQYVLVVLISRLVLVLGAPPRRSPCSERAIFLASPGRTSACWSSPSLCGPGGIPGILTRGGLAAGLVPVDADGCLPPGCCRASLLLRVRRLGFVLVWAIMVHACFRTLMQRSQCSFTCTLQNASAHSGMHRLGFVLVWAIMVHACFRTLMQRSQCSFTCTLQNASCPHVGYHGPCMLSYAHAEIAVLLHLHIAECQLSSCGLSWSMHAFVCSCRDRSAPSPAHCRMPVPTVACADLGLSSSGLSWSMHAFIRSCMLSYSHAEIAVLLHLHIAECQYPQWHVQVPPFLPLGELQPFSGSSSHRSPTRHTLPHVQRGRRGPEPLLAVAG